MSYQYLRRTFDCILEFSCSKQQQKDSVMVQSCEALRVVCISVILSVIIVDDLFQNEYVQVDRKRSKNQSQRHSA